MVLRKVANTLSKVWSRKPCHVKGSDRWSPIERQKEGEEERREEKGNNMDMTFQGGQLTGPVRAGGDAQRGGFSVSRYPLTLPHFQR